jgi:hypothetical protein
MTCDAIPRVTCNEPSIVADEVGRLDKATHVVTLLSLEISMDTSLSQPSTSTADNIGKFDPPWIARRTDTRPASTGQPSVNEMRSYFGQLGYRSGKDADDYLAIDRPETDWFISRQRFIGPRVLWRWWRCETWLAMNKAVVCRMLEAWYATGTPHERVEIE